MALLITNVRFAKKEMYRHGAEKDEEDMSKLLISLGYNVEKHRDLRGAEMDKAVKRFSKDPLLAATDSVFVVIMSHGVKGAISGVHHCEGVPDQFPIDNIFKHLDSAHCPLLEGKPKVIIIQACRGDKDGSAIVTDGPGSVPEQAPVVQVDAALPPHLAEEVDADIEEDAIHRVHIEKDFVSLLSCTADTLSYRDRQQGSYFIQHLVEIFNLHSRKDHIENLFKRASHPDRSR
ncbi:caspase a-like [Gadus macrocephalus]|uniref:caspase a-like n=1 Tax=Gadus macrocephalus TaxID=80720 RepID=UPI0028CB3382|nr:caspase a-like [Gadus macrocephalus]